MMKTLLLLASSCVLSLTMVGCTHLQTTSSAPLSGTVSTNQPIIAYFDPDSGEEECSCGSTMDKGYSLTPIENGFYRKLLGRDAQGRFLIQDFYQNSDKKQTSPFWIIEPQGLNSFDSKYTDGDVINYRENGNIQFKSTYKDQKLVGKSFDYYANSQLAIETEFLDEETTIQKRWYENGKPAVNQKMNPADDYLILERTVFDEQGNTIEDEDQAQNIIDTISEKVDQ